MGPTASGKSELAESLAKRFDAQLISADAFQVYRGFDIGTAKPTLINQYELIDIRDPREGFGVGEFVHLAQEALHQLWLRRRNAIVVGGTGLYIRALMEQFQDLSPQPSLDLRSKIQDRLGSAGLQALVDELLEKYPEEASRTDLANPRRVTRALERVLEPLEKLVVALPPFRQFKFGLLPDSELNHRSIQARLHAMMQGGFIEEVQQLLQQGISRDAPAMAAIGYRTMYRHVEGEISGEDAVERIEIETRQYAKRQRTWMRSEPNLIMIESDSLVGRANLVFDAMELGKE